LLSNQNLSEKLRDVKFGEKQNNGFRQKQTNSESVSPEQRRIFFLKNLILVFSLILAKFGSLLLQMTASPPT